MDEIEQQRAREARAAEIEDPTRNIRKELIGRAVEGTEIDEDRMLLLLADVDTGNMTDTEKIDASCKVLSEIENKIREVKKEN